MLIISLFFSAVLLLAANLLVIRSGWKVVGTALMVLAVPVSCIFPPVAIQALLLGLATVVFYATGRRPASFIALSCVATLAAYCVAGLMVAGTEREYAHLRALYPYESMEARLPIPGLGLHEPPPPVAARLAGWEGSIEQGANGYRAMKLNMLHEHAIELFVNSPGFGNVRMLPPTGRSLVANLRREPVPSQPGPRVASPWSPGEWERLPAGEEPPLTQMFEESVADFVNPRGFGFVRDRRHVAGFESHRFSQLPAAARRWTVQTLDLVSLLLHEEPAVYVSDHLPRMDQARGMPTRPLDNFEASGLASVRVGDDPFISRSGGVVRMLGGVRSVRQCVACHGGERGDLLGAFSYTIRLAAQ